MKKRNVAIISGVIFSLATLITLISSILVAKATKQFIVLSNRDY